MELMFLKIFSGEANLRLLERKTFDKLAQQLLALIGGVEDLFIERGKGKDFRRYMLFVVGKPPVLFDD